MHGDVVLIGLEASSCSPTGTMLVERGDPSERSSIPIVAGRWSTDWPAGEALTIRAIRLGWLEWEPLESTISAAASPVHVIAAPRDSTVLHVLSAADSRELGEIEIARATDWTQETRLWIPEPDAQALVACGLESPFTLPAPEQPHALWVRAPGHAWQRVVLQPAGGDSRTVLLAPSGELDVSFGTGASAPRGAVLEIYARGKRSAIGRIPVGGQAGARLTSLEPVQYDLRLAAASVVLGTAQALVEAGLTRSVTMSPRRAPETRYGRLEVGLQAHATSAELDVDGWTIQVSPAEGKAGGARDVLRVRDASRSRSTPTLYTWPPVRLPVGRYRLAVHPIQHSVEVEVSANTTATALLETPPLTRVALTFVGADGGLREIDEAFWSSSIGPGDCTSCRGEALSAGNPAVFLAPEGEVAVEAYAVSGESASERLPVFGASIEHVVRLQGGCSIQLTVTGPGGVAYPTDMAWWEGVELSATDSTGAARLFRFPELAGSVFFSSCTVELSAPGTYVIRRNVGDGLDVEESTIPVTAGQPALARLSLRP